MLYVILVGLTAGTFDKFFLWQLLCLTRRFLRKIDRITTVFATSRYSYESQNVKHSVQYSKVLFNKRRGERHRPGSGRHGPSFPVFQVGCDCSVCQLSDQTGCERPKPGPPGHESRAISLGSYVPRCEGRRSNIRTPRNI